MGGRAKGDSHFTYLSQGIKVSTSVISHVDVMYSGQCDENGAVPLWPFKDTSPRSNHERNVRQISTEGHFTKYLTKTPQYCQVIKTPGASQKFIAKRSPRRHDT